MSHTTVVGDTTFIHNGDFSGEVEVIRGGGVMSIPFAHLKLLVADWARVERKESIDMLSDDQVLLGP